MISALRESHENPENAENPSKLKPEIAKNVAHTVFPQYRFQRNKSPQKNFNVGNTYSMLGLLGRLLRATLPRTAGKRRLDPRRKKSPFQRKSEKRLRPTLNKKCARVQEQALSQQGRSQH